MGFDADSDSETSSPNRTTGRELRPITGSCVY